MNYIIQQGVQIGNPKNKIIDVLTSDQINSYLKDGFRLKERMYKLTSGHSQYTVVCWEVWKESGAEHSLILPEFLIPHRTYAVYVYAYAIALYSTDPGKSQRAVAEETRKKFNLQTFAHTTVGRAMRELAQILTVPASADNKTITGVRVTEQAEDNETAAGGQAKEQNGARKVNKADGGTDPTGRFSALYTKAQRELVRSFFSSRANSLKQEGAQKACVHIVAYWYMDFRCLFDVYLHQTPGVRLVM